MANTYDTSGEPLGSTAVKVLYNNASNLDDATNSDLDTWIDRPPFGRVRRTWRGMENAFDQFLANSGFETPPLVYVDGTPLQVDRPTQLIQREGFLYSIKLPSPTPFPVTLSGTWATDEPLLVIRSDQALRTELADPATVTSGAALVARAAQFVPSYAAVRALSKATASKFAFVSGADRSGAFYLDEADTTSADNNINTLVGTDGGRWKLADNGPITVKQAGITGAGDAADLTAYTNAATVLGYLHFGPGLYTMPTATFTVPVYLDPGAILTVPSGRTLTVSGALTADYSEHFRGTGTISIARWGVPEWFGAGLGSGANADAAPIQKAIDSCGGVELMPVTYKIGTATILHSRTISVLGGGRERTILLTSGAAHGGWKTYSQNALGDAVVAYEVGNFGIRHDAVAVPTSGLHLEILWASNGSVHDIKCTGGYNGFQFGTATGVVCSRIQMVAPLNEGIVISAGSLDFTFHEVGCYGLVGATRVTNRGLLMNGAQIEGFKINHMQLVGCKTAGIVTSASTNTRECPSFGRFDSLYADSCGNGFHIAVARDLQWNSCWFATTAVGSSEPYGVQISTCWNQEFSNCQATNNAGNGMTIGPAAIGTRVLGGTFSSNGTASIASGIQNAGARGTTIMGANCDNSMLSGTQSYGITNEATSSDYIIVNNQLKGNNTASFNNLASNPGSISSPNIV